MAYTARKTNSPESNRDELISRIPGWGADLDYKNRPAVPKEKRPPGGTGAHWIVPDQQQPRFKIHKSVEHKHLTPVFGTACPPKGISGLIRNYAYKFSEGRLSHWMLLLFADRIDVLESNVVSVLKGRPDNPITEMGLSAEFKRGGQRNRIPKEALLVAGLALMIPAIRLLKGKNQSPYDRKIQSSRFRDQRQIA